VGASNSMYCHLSPLMGLLHVAMVLSQELNLIAEINICGSYEILPNCCRGELNSIWVFSCLHRASTVSKHFFINPTDAHNYKITRMLRHLKFPQLLWHVSVHSGTIIKELFLA